MLTQIAFFPFSRHIQPTTRELNNFMQNLTFTLTARIKEKSKKIPHYLLANL